MPQRFVYRNRLDDRRRPVDMFFCSHCNGWYGVSHEYGHCQKDRPTDFGSKDCACRFCKEKHGKAVTGDFGFFTTAEEWQPPRSVLDENE